MKISVTGQQIDVGGALRNYVSDRLLGEVEKYFDKAIEGHVAFSREGPMIRTHLSVHVGKGIMMECEAKGDDINGSFTEAVEHLNKQLRRHKRRLRDHHKGSEDAVRECQG